MRSTKDLNELEVPFEVLVTVGTGCVVTRDWDSVQELFDFMCRCVVPPHKIPYMGGEVGNRLIGQFPWLKKLKFHKVKDEASAKRFVEKYAAIHGQRFIVKAPETGIDLGDIFEGITPDDVAMVDAPNVSS